MNACSSIARTSDILDTRDALAVGGSFESRTAVADMVGLRSDRSMTRVRKVARATAEDWSALLVTLVTDRQGRLVELAVDDFAATLADALQGREWRATHGQPDEAAMDNAHLLRALAASLNESADWLEDEASE